jgi:hypothetical protein
MAKTKKAATSAVAPEWACCNFSIDRGDSVGGPMMIKYGGNAPIEVTGALEVFQGFRIMVLAPPEASAASAARPSPAPTKKKPARRR